MSFKIDKPGKKIGRIVTFRPSKDVSVMLYRATKDHPIVSQIVNECIRRHLTQAGYARKREVGA